MKKLIIAASATMTLAFVVPASADAEEVDVDEYCGVIHGLATTVMTKRQKGIAVTKLMAIAEGKPMVGNIIMAAYRQHRFMATTYQQGAIDDFANDTYLECMREMGK